MRPQKRTHVLAQFGWITSEFPVTMEYRWGPLAIPMRASGTSSGDTPIPITTQHNVERERVAAGQDLRVRNRAHPTVILVRQ